MNVRRSRAGGRGVVTMLSLAALLSMVAHAQLQEHDALTPVIGGLPLSTGVVVVSNKPSSVLESLRGPWKRLGPVAAGLSGDALKSWGAVARELGHEPGEAFTALTSGGLAVVVGGGAHGDVQINGGKGDVAVDTDAHWAVLTVVKAEVAARVRERLKASPHAVIGGLPVLSLEDGHYALVCRGLTAREGGDEVLALTPMEDQAFLTSVVAAVEAARPNEGGEARVKPEETLASTKAFERAKRTTADVLILAADTSDHGKADVQQPAAWRRASVMACTLTDRSWTVDATAADAEGAAHKVDRLPPEAAAWFDAWSPKASVMVVGSGLREIIDALASAPGGAAMPGAKLMDGTQSVGLFMGPSPAAAKAGAPAGGGAGMSVWSAVKVRQRRVMPMTQVDAVGCAVATALESDLQAMLAGNGRTKGKGQPAEADPRAMALLPGSALRVVSVKLPPGGPLSGSAPGDGSPTPGSVAWFQCGAPGSAGGEQDPGWLVMGFEPVDDADVMSGRSRAVKALLAEAAVKAAPSRAWVWRGVVRPASMVESLPMPMGLALSFSGIGSVREVRFETWEEEGGAEPVAHTRVVVEWKGAGGEAKP